MWGAQSLWTAGRRRDSDMPSSKMFPALQVGLIPVNTFNVTTVPLYDNISFPALVIESLKTLFLFTKSDFKTILVPVTVFAITTAPLHENASIPPLIFWIWLHILQCALANQSLQPEEDALNKPDRPIPAGRITVAEARFLRWACVPACLALSAWYSYAVFQASAALAFFLYIYNELEMNSHWLSRNILNGAGLACFEVGATLLAGHNRSSFGPTPKLAITISTCIFITTIHAQDFKDVLGDIAVGRRTLPMIFPMASRILVLFTLVAWSLGLAFLWETGPFIAGGMLVLGGMVGGRFTFLKSISDDQKSFYLYNVWLSLANALPALSSGAM